MRNGIDARVRPGVVVRAVVGGVEHDGVVGHAQFVDQVQQFADMHVVFHHAVVVLVAEGSADAGMLVLDVGAEVHPGGVPPGEPGLAGIVLALDEVLGRGQGLLVHGFHALLGQRPGVLDFTVGAEALITPRGP